MAKMGRPTLFKDKKEFLIALEREDHEKLIALARSKGLFLNAFIRQLLIERLAQED